MKDPNWKLFEKRIVNETKMLGLVCFKVPEEIVGFYGKKPAKKKSELDFVAAVPEAIFFDAKVTEENLWNIKKHCEHPDKCHQLAKVLDFHDRGVISGYLIWFVKHQAIVWFGAADYIRYKKAGKLSIYPSPDLRFTSDDVNIDLRKLCGTQSKV